MGSGKNKIVGERGIVHIKASFNNIIVTVTDMNGNALSWSSSGKSGFRGAKKNTPYAAQITTISAAKEAYNLGVRSVDVFVRGPGSGRDAAARSLQTVGLVVKSITDRTPLPHNGCRPPKRRRV